ncbi:type I-G CRISPR-associated protein Csb2 [Halorhodospira halophila]|uniref:type I-G CRISPR-associated protein Csb2 n=1 Tax=Halorhodospira halophila TaxID=1053 RepID=UPI0019126D93|nr:type I-U CRISPR-associated protein Csb2 [Halorhodospira halophila]MBK5943808.1 type I-U CRISPR-associated protein Cas5/Cas6 [Halorhodospira halophila]
MPVLHLTIHWLAAGPGQGSYHGEEWPPSPARVFRALLAAACRPGGPGQRGREALARLEQLDPPQILGPAAERLEPVRTAVPNNDGDVVLGLYHKGRTEQARKKTSALKTMRLRQGWSVPGPVEYRWHFPEPDPDPQAFEQLADSLTHLGQGIDLAYANAEWLESPRPQWGYAWRPDETLGNEMMPVPSPGEIERMDALHEGALGRIRGPHVSSSREPPVAFATYQDPLVPPAKRWQAFTLRLPDDAGPLAVSGAQAMRVTGMVRHAVHRAAQQAGLDETTIQSLMGHGGPGKIQALAIPNVAHDWADGRIRRVVLAAPPAVDAQIWDAVVLRMVSAELIDADSGEIQGLLAPVAQPREDKLLWRFTDSARVWSAATPVIFPGFDTRRGRPRPEKAVRRMLRHAGIPQEAVRRVRIDDAPQLPGVCSARSVALPHYLRSYPRKFLTVEFQKRVAGPLILGAGEGSGLGLLTHCEQFSAASNPGERSQRRKAS